MVAPWQETQFRVVIEFKKANQGASREIRLSRTPTELPSQLYGRITPQVWGTFVTELEQLTHTHPYLAKANASYVGNNALAFVGAVVTGFGLFSGDAGDYGEWLRQVDSVLARYQRAFAAGGAALSIGRVHGSYWVQVDVDPRAMAVGAPVPTGVPAPGYEAPAMGTPAHPPGMPAFAAAPAPSSKA